MARLRTALREIFQPVIPPDASPQRRWEMRVEGPMLIVSIAFLALFAWTTLGRSGALWTTVAEVGMWMTWVTFVVDYVVRLVLAENRLRWFFRHLWELAIVILPMFRALRILRIVPILVLLQRYSATHQRVTVALYTACGSILLIFVAALSIYDLEASDPHSQIDNFADALWWSVVTVTTVGYGDIAPVSASGRLVAVVLMSGGIAIVGVVTATVASWLVEQVESTSPARAQRRAEKAFEEREARHRQDELMEQITALRAEVAALREEVATSRRTGGDATTGDVG